MGTNYYIESSCDHCGRSDRLHIGKSSAGWRFLARLYETEEEGPVDWLTWLDRIGHLDEDERLVDEFGTFMSVENFFRLVLAKSTEHVMNGGCSLHRGEELPPGSYPVDAYRNPFG